LCYIGVAWKLTRMACCLISRFNSKFEKIKLHHFCHLFYSKNVFTVFLKEIGNLIMHMLMFIRYFFIQSYKLFHNTLFTFLSGTVWQCGEMEFKLSSCYCFRLTRTNGQIFRFLFFAKTIRGKLWKSLLWLNNDTWSLNLELRIKLTLLPLFFL